MHWGLQYRPEGFNLCISIMQFFLEQVNIKFNNICMSDSSVPNPPKVSQSEPDKAADGLVAALATIKDSPVARSSYYSLQYLRLGCY